MEHKDDDAIATSGEGSSDSETRSTCSEESNVLCCSTSLGADEPGEYCLPLARLQLRPLQWWLKQHYKGPSDMFKTMPITEEARHNLEWWHSFKSCPKSIHRPSVQEVVMTDALTKGFGGECNQPAF